MVGNPSRRSSTQESRCVPASNQASTGTLPRGLIFKRPAAAAPFLIPLGARHFRAAAPCAPLGVGVAIGLVDGERPHIAAGPGCTLQDRSRAQAVRPSWPSCSMPPDGTDDDATEAFRIIDLVHDARHAISGICVSQPAAGRASLHSMGRIRWAFRRSPVRLENLTSKIRNDREGRQKRIHRERYDRGWSSPGNANALLTLVTAARTGWPLLTPRTKTGVACELGMPSPATFPIQTGTTPGPPLGKRAIVATSMLRCSATSAGGRWVSQFESETSS